MVRPVGIRWDRVGRIALLAVLVVILALYVPPIGHWLTQSQTASERSAEVAELEAEQARLRARIQRLSGPPALEREARRLGMVRKGERPFVVQNVPAR